MSVRTVTRTLSEDGTAYKLCSCRPEIQAPEGVYSFHTTKQARFEQTLSFQKFSTCKTKFSTLRLFNYMLGYILQE